MKKWICIALIVTMTAAFAACGEKKQEQQNDPAQSEQNAGQPGASGAANDAQNPQGSAQDAQNVQKTYDAHDIRFDIPTDWQGNFLAEYQQHGDGDTAYEATVFSCHIGQNDVMVMTIAVFGEKQWETIKASSPDAAKMEFATSKDGKTHYTLRIEDQKMNNEEEQKVYDAIRAAAQSISGKITITK